MKNTVRNYLPPLISGIALIFCFPSFDYGYLSFIVLVPFLIHIHKQENRRAFMSGFLLGLPYFFGTGYWVAHSINKYGGMNLTLSYLMVLLLAIYLSLYTGMFAAMFASKIRSTSMPAVIVAPLFWVMMEYMRSILFTGMPYSLIGYTQYEFIRFIQISDITGVYGVSFLVVAVNGAIADFFIMKKRRAEKPLFHLSPTFWGIVALCLILVTTMTYGTYKLKQTRPGHEIKAAIVQPNIEQDMKWDVSYQGQVMRLLMDMSLRASAKQPDIIIWPETAIPFYYGMDPVNTRILTSFVDTLSIPLVTGGITVKESKKGEEKGKRPALANSSIVFDKNGKNVFTYDKTHLVPFGEYVPLKNILGFIDKIVVGIGDYKEGDSFDKYKWEKGSFSSAICYEIAFPSLIRKFYKRGGDFLVTITNDAWFGKTTGPYHHFAMTVFRAIENRKPVLRAANTGVSAIIDSSGRTVAKTQIFEKNLIIENIRTDSTISIYSKYGDLFIYFCTIITIILIADIRRK